MAMRVDLRNARQSELSRFIHYVSPFELKELAEKIFHFLKNCHIKPKILRIPYILCLHKMVRLGIIHPIPMRTLSLIATLSAIGPLSQLSAQNLTGANRLPEVGNKWSNNDPGQDRGFVADSSVTSLIEVPALRKVCGEAVQQNPVFVAQNFANLDSQLANPRHLETVIDLNLLREPSPFVKIPVSASGGAGVSDDVMKKGLAKISAVYRENGKTEQAADCSSISLSVEQRIKLDTSKLLEIVETEVAANPSCVCEVVKAAIKASDADVVTVVSIVEVAIAQAPESMRIAAQCAIAAVPESIDGVQALLTKLDPNGGDGVYSAKSSKSAKGSKAGVASDNPVAAMADPLDFPGGGIGPRLTPGLPFIPPVIITPSVTVVDP
jgi:hypothetical protein